jgi:hypothetical protein
MKIGIDIDNVIANTYQDLAKHFNQFMGKDYEPKEVVETMRREKLKMWAYFLDAWRKQIMAKVSLIEGAAETIRAWHHHNTISLITSRNILFNRQTKSWLKQNDIPYHQLHHAKETTKHQKAAGCTFFIEDNLEECEILANHCDRIFLFDQPWNHRPIKQSNIYRVSSWQQIRALVL